MPLKSSQGTVTSLAFEHCEWPPPPYASQDGFFEVSMTTGYTGLAEYTGASTYDLITGPCKVFKLQYEYVYMLPPPYTPVPQAPFDLAQDALTTATTGISIPSGVPSPSPGDAIFVRNDHIQPMAASCVS